MIKIFGVEINTSDMTEQDLFHTQEMLSTALVAVDHELKVRKMAKHNHATSST